MEITTNQKGQIAQLKVEARAVEKGWVVSRTSEGARYDLVLDNGSKLYRAQVKWGESKHHNAEGSVQVNLRRFVGNDRDGKRTKTKTYSKDEIDVLLVYVPQVDKVCWFGAEHFDGKPMLIVRYLPTKNGQKYKTRMVGDYVW